MITIPGFGRFDDIECNEVLITTLNIHHDTVLESLRAYGDHATSFQILEPRYEYWFYALDNGPPAVVAWVQAGRYRAVAGIPVAPPDHLAQVSQRFVRESMEAGFRVLFFCADARFISAIEGLPDFNFGLIPIGQQPEWNPRGWELNSPEKRTVRQQCNRALNKGVTIRRLTPSELNEPSTRTEIADVLERWLNSRQMSSLGFLVDLQPFHHAAERRYYVAEAGSRAVGFLAAIPVYARQGWFFEDVIRVPDAPNGTTELLIHTAMKDAQASGEDWVTLGLSPLAGIEESTVERPVLIWLLKQLRRHGEPFYRFNGLRQFKARFKPELWTSQFIVQCPSGHTVSAIHAVLDAFAGGGLASFVVDTMRRMLRRIPLRYWAIMLVLLAGLLVPWTILLALADGSRWFGDESIQNAWVAFDAFLAIALAVLGWLTWRGKPIARSGALFLAGTTLTDFVLTTVQAFNLHQDVSGGPALFVLAGMLGPISASLFLITMHFTAPFPRSVGRVQRTHRMR